MNKVRKTLVVVFSALFVLCMALFAVGCGDTNNAETPDETKSAYSVSVDVNDPSLGKYTLTAANSGDAYVQGTSVTVTVEPNEDYEASLVVNGEEVALTDNTYTFTVEGDTDLQVNYNYIYVAYTNVIAGKGTVTLSEPKNGSAYEKGEEVTVTVEAADGYELKSLRINNDYVSLTDGAVKFQITGKTYVFAEFVALHTVTVENEDAKGTVAMRANGKAVESGVVLAEGTEVELTVTPLGGNTVKAVYVAGARTPLEAGKATFTLQKDSVVEVVYDTYYTVALPVEAEGGSVTLSEEAATLGYLDGTVLTLTVEPAEGYVVTSFKVTVGGKEVEGAKLNFNKYTFTVTADVTIEVEFETKEAVLTYNVDIAYSNSGYGVATLSEEANDDGTYSYGTELALTVTPNDGFKVSYVTINGNRAEAQEDGTYAITVMGDIEIYVCFTKAARFSVRVEMYGLTGVTAALQIGENAAQAPDEGNQYIKAECYEGQSVTVSVTIDELDDGMQLYYYLNDSERILYVGEDIVIDEVTENVTIRLAAEAPTAPAYTFNTVVGNDTEAQPEPDYTGVVASCTLQDGKYTLTLKAPADPEGYVFDSWKVEVGGEVLTPDETTGAYTFDYNDEGMEVVLTATWNKTINVTLPDSAASNGTVTVVEGEGPYIKGATLTIKVEPKAGYRIKTVSVSANGQAIPVEVELASGAQEYEVTAADDLTVAVEYEAIYTYTYETLAHASFTIEAESDEDFLEYDAETRVYTFDTVSSYIITFTLESDDYQFTSITVNETPVDLSGEAYTYTGALLAETKIEVVAKKLAAVTYTITPEREDNFFSVEIKAGGADGELVEYGDKLISGTEIYIHFTVPEGYEAYFTGSFGGFNVHHTNVTNMNNLTCYVTDNGLYFELEFVLLPVELDYTFPAEDSSDPSNHLPTQGIWTNGEEENEQILKVEKNTMYVNGDPVTDFQIDPLNPTTKFNITTNNAAGEEKHYTLEWFGGEQGFILALTNTTPASTPAPAPAPAPAGRRNAANDAAAPAEPDVVYLVNPVYGDSYFAPYKEGDKDTLVGENKTWTYKTDTAENVIVFTEEAEKAHVSFNGTAASYVFAVESGHYLFVVGASAYDMTITDNGNSITVNDEKYLLPTTYTVTVTETGKVEGCSYTLKNGEADVASGSAVQENAKLTLTLTLATDYTATVTVNGTAVTAKEGSTNVYEITVTSATEIAITYVAPTTYTVTVDEIGKPEGTQDLWYELKKGETAVASGSEVVKDSVLTLTLKAPEGYTATVKVGETDLTAQDGVYTIPAITAETTITITYTAPVVEKKIIAASGAHLEGALFLITVQTNGNFTLDELKTAVKLVGGTNECSPANVVAVAETTDKFTLHFNAIVDWAVAETGYILSLKVNDVAVELDLTTDAQGSTVDFNNQKTFTLSVSEGKLVLTVSAYVAPTPTTYTVEIVENGKVTGCSVEVKNGEATVTSGGTVPTDATLKVTVTLPQGYTATVEVVGGTKAQEGNVYTITNLTGNVTITITYAEEGEVTPAIEIPIVAFNANGNSDLKDVTFSAENYALIQENATYVVVNDYAVSSGWQAGKGFNPEGNNTFKVIITNMGAFDPNDFTLNWYKGGENGQGGTLWATSHWKVEVDPTEVQRAQNEEDASNNPKYKDSWVLFDPSNYVKSAKYENGVLTLTFSDYDKAVNWWDLQLYYIDSHISVGQKYTVSFSIKSSVAGTYYYFQNEGWQQSIEFKTANETIQFVSENQGVGTVNKATIRFFMCIPDGARISEGTIEISNLVIAPVEMTTLSTPSIAFEGKNYTITDNNSEEGLDHFEIGLYKNDILYHTYTTTAKTGTIDDSMLANGTYQAKIRAIAKTTENYLSSDWSQGVDYSVSNASRQYQLRLSPEGDMPTDEWVYWTDRQNNIIESENSFNNGTITFNFHNNTEAWYSTQLFYRSPELTAKPSSVLMYIQSDKAMTIRVNGQNVTLIAGLNTVYVTQQNGGNADISIQFSYDGDTARVTEAHIIISNVQFNVPAPHVHTFENGVCTGCSAVCGHEGQSGATCELCGATLVSGDAYTRDNVVEFSQETWVDIPVALTKGEQLIIYGTQTTTMTDTVAEKDGQANPTFGQPANHGTVIWECKEGFTGRMDNWGWGFGNDGNFGAAVTGKVLQNLNASGEVVEGVFDWTLYQDICKDSIWLIRIAYANESVLTVSMYATSLSGDHAGYTFVCVYDVPISAGKAQAQYTFHLTAGSTGGCTKFSVTGYSKATVATTPDTPVTPETGTKNVPASEIPAWADPYLPSDVATLTDGTTVKITGQFSNAGDATWNGLMYFLRNGQTNQLLYVFRQAGDCADVTGEWVYGKGSVSPGFMGVTDSSDPAEAAKANAYVALKKNAKFEVVVTYSNSTVTITVTVFGDDDAQTTDDQVLSVVLSNMTSSSYKLALALDSATLTDAGLTVTTTVAAE